jgi:hypothetical protein
MFCKLFILGAMVLILSNFVFVGENSETLCILRPWIFHLSFTFMFANLFTKVYRAWRIFGNRSLNAVKFSTAQMYTTIASFVLVDFVILLAWTIFDPPKPTETVVTFTGGSLSVSMCSSKLPIFPSSLGLYKAALLIGGCYLSYITRHMHSAFAESTYIMYSIYNITVVGGLVLLVIDVIKVNPASAILLQTLGVILGAGGAVFIVIGPKILAIFRGDADVVPTGSSATQETEVNSENDNGHQMTEILKNRIMELEAQIAQATKEKDEEPRPPVDP